MPRSKTTIPRSADHWNRVIVRNTFVEQDDDVFLEATPKFVPPIPQNRPDRPSKPFFFRWLDDWKARNQEVRQ